MFYGLTYGRLTYGVAAVCQSTRHCPEYRHKSLNMQQQHPIMMTSSQQLALVSVAEADILGQVHWYRAY